MGRRTRLDAIENNAENFLGIPPGTLTFTRYVQGSGSTNGKLGIYFPVGFCPDPLDIGNYNASTVECDFDYSYAHPDGSFQGWAKFFDGIFLSGDLTPDP